MIATSSLEGNLAVSKAKKKRERERETEGERERPTNMHHSIF